MIAHLQEWPFSNFLVRQDAVSFLKLTLEGIYFKLIFFWVAITNINVRPAYARSLIWPKQNEQKWKGENYSNNNNKNPLLLMTQPMNKNYWCAWILPSNDRKLDNWATFPFFFSLVLASILCKLSNMKLLSVPSTSSSLWPHNVMYSRSFWPSPPEPRILQRERKPDFIKSDLFHGLIVGDPPSLCPYNINSTYLLTVFLLFIILPCQAL